MAPEGATAEDEALDERDGLFSCRHKSLPMSDHWIAIIPRNPHFVPADDRIAAGEEYLKSLAPESEEISSSVDAGVMFRDCGENLESIQCPKCQADLDQEWWSEALSEDEGEAGFKLATYLLPCCRKKATLNELVYHFDQGFSRFILEAMNPNIGELEREEIQHLEELLGTPLKVIYQHI